MTQTINIDDFLAELRHVVAANDVIKGTILLNHFDQLDAKGENQFLSFLGGADGEMVITLLARLLVSDKQFAIPKAVIRNLLLARVMKSPKELLGLLTNEQIRQKQVFVELAGEIQLDEAIPVLEQILGSTTDDLALMKACLIALGNIGMPDPINTLSDFLYSGHRELVIAAINALSNIDTPVSVRRLVERMGTDSDLDIIIIDALANLQDALALDQLNKELNSQHAYIRNHVKSRLAKIGAKAIPTLVGNLGSKDIDLLVHSLNVLGYIGDLSAVRAIRKLLHEEPADANVRFAAYESLGMMPLAKGAYVLAEGLSDPVDQVRIAAARAIEWNCDDILVAGVRNLVVQGGKEAEHVVEAFLNSESHKIVFSVIDLEIFQKLAVTFLNKKAHPDLKKRYEDLFREKGYSELADKLLKKKIGKEEEKLLVFAVDDSRMILSIYKNTLFQLGMDSQLFEFPAIAIEKATVTKPDVLLTDLNMPEITGIELTRQMRALYSPQELPIVMVTTQSDSPDHKEAYEVGVNMILAKPFTADQLQAAIGEVLGKK
ncbi:MAG: response regulator [Deltaproteobacteria bacterium]|nr:response regulator [Deltaproteobacteria bacterium]